MPAILLFTVCERVIIGADKTISLISILTGANLTVNLAGLEQFIEPDTQAPVNWELVSIWSRMPNDPDPVGTKYQQHGAIFTPSGRLIPLRAIEFEFGDASISTHRTVGKVPQFPIAEEGVYAIAVGLSPIDSKLDTLSTTHATTWVRVIHENKPKPIAV
jgi:hypothetical protein